MFKTFAGLVKRLCISAALLWFVSQYAHCQLENENLPNTSKLMMEGDIASHLVDGVDRFLLRKLDESVEDRAEFWSRETSSPEAYLKSIAPQRKRLAHILGVRDSRPAEPRLWIDCKARQEGIAVKGKTYAIYYVRWDAFGDVTGDGLLLVPDGEIKANLVVIPDADQTPEQLVGIAGKSPSESRLIGLAANGCRIVVPRLVSRKMQRRRNVELSNREYVYRPAFELGRHIVGYETQKVLAAIDGLFANSVGDKPIAVAGHGEGGFLAMCAAALDTRIDAVAVSGFFSPRENVWEQPIDRNIFGYLKEFGDAELATMIAPRPFLVSTAPGPVVQLPGKGGAPAALVSPNKSATLAELNRAKALIDDLPWECEIIDEEEVDSAPFYETVVKRMVELPPNPAIKPLSAKTVDPVEAENKLIQQLDSHTQRLLVESPYMRKQFMQKMDVSSVEAHGKTVGWYRDFFRNDVIGQFDDELLVANPRTRKRYDTDKWVGYDVVLDVFPDVIAFGVLLVPKDLKEDERRPAVVCQHGLEGRPKDTIEGDKRAYHDFSAKLAERGFVVFAPQNLYIFRDRFRTLQRKANPLGKTLFSIMVPQHQQITDWLATLPFVDADRIGFYGLSYGGKSAMRIPPLVDRYCLSICSADFNDWVWKNASTRSPYSYVWTGEYEIFEFDLGSTFNYSEMAALIAPRPFMVERGHFDGVAPDERVALEFAKVRHLYQAQLGIGDKCEIEWFVGPHTINGQATYDFLHRHLNWPKPE